MAKRRDHRVTYTERLEAEKLYKIELNDAAVAGLIGVSRMIMYRERKRGLIPCTNMYEANQAQRNNFS